MFKSNLPWYARLFVSGFTESYDSYFLWGDIEEIFEHKKESNGILKAHLWLIIQLIKSIPPLIIDNILWSISMFRNYLKVAYRNIIRNKVYSFINITGLSIGLVCCILIYMFVDYELSFDKHHSNYDNIYRVVSQSNYGGEIAYDAGAPFPLANALRNDMPGLKSVTHIYYLDEIQAKVNNEAFIEKNILFADTSFLKIFDYEFLIGNKASIMSKNSSAVLTETTAKKYFGNKSPLGEILLIDNQLKYEVTGIIKDPPQNTSLPFNILLPFNSITEELIGLDLDRWNVSSSNSNVFVLLAGHTKVDLFSPKFEEMKRKYLPEKKWDKEFFELQPLSAMHYNSNYHTFIYAISMETIYIFLAIGLAILVIAGVNYVNLSTAQAVKRAKEVGMRKVLGAYRKQLIKQFIGETTIYTTLAFLLAILLAELCVGYVNDFLDNGASLSLLNSPSIILPLMFIYIASILLAGFYPSIVLSAFTPAKAFKKGINKKTGTKGFSLRNGLVVFQFAVSQVLIISTFVVSTQMDYFKNKELGFRKNEVISVSLPERDYNKNLSFANSLKSMPSVENVTMALGTPTSDNLVDTRFTRPGITIDSIPVQIKAADENYADVFDLKLVAGRFLNKHVEGDTLKKWVVNESLIRKAGFDNPQDAVGEYIDVSRHRGEIIGVVKDFHPFSLHEEIMPLVFTNKFQRFFATVSVKYNSGRTNNLNKGKSDSFQPEYSVYNTSATKQTLDAIEAKWKEFFPAYSFSHEFFDEYLRRLYETEDRLFTIIKVFTLLAVFIGCLGLLGLISFTVVQKTKEIGIRKVLGASSGSIVLIITREFLRNGVIACLLGWPIAFYFMNDWLQSFAYRVELSWWMFLSAGIIGLAIILFSVSFQSIKAALSNPINSIRYE